MAFRISRRRFIAGIGVAAASSALSNRALAALFPSGSGIAKVPGDTAALLYPPMDLSYFDTPIKGAEAQFHLGYASITWSGEDRKAIADIASLGFPGIQLRADVIKEFASPAELKDLLQQQHLTFVALSSGSLSIDPAVE